jgi:hypothetical protein
MTSRTSRWCGLIAALALASVSPAFAADPEKAAPSEPSPEVRQQMAAVHQKMADCLRFDRPIAECKAEMKKSHEMMGERGCPMMGSTGGGMGPGMMGGGMMQGRPAPEAPKK